MATPSKTPAPEQTEEDKVDALIDAVAPAIKRREQKIIAASDSPYAGFDRTYTQQKLAFFAKLEFLRLASRAINRAVGSEGGDTLDLQALTQGIQTSGDNTQMFVMAITRLAEFAPEIVKDIYLLALGVPSHERPIVSEIMGEPHDDETGHGGLSDEDGVEILLTFAAQNGKAMRDFFLTEMPKVGAALQAAVAGPASTPEPSKPSKRSARSTQ